MRSSSWCATVERGGSPAGCSAAIARVELDARAPLVPLRQVAARAIGIGFELRERGACGRPVADEHCGLELCESLKHAVKEKGLKGKVRVAKSGCLDLCEQGPNAFVYPEGEWLSHLTQADVPGIIDKFQNP